MKAAFAAGGSGGHVYPAVSVALALEARLGGSWAREGACFLVTAGGLEQRLLEPYPYPRAEIRAARLQGRNVVRFAYALLAGILDARRHLRAFRPDVLLAAGGFVSAPSALAAWSLGVPVVVLEQNSVPGRANRLVARVAAAVVTAFPEAKGHFPRGARVELLGNPLRYERPPGPQRQPGARPTLLVLGGSQGARCINEAVVEALPRLLRELGLDVTLICGARDEPWVRERTKLVGAELTVLAYCDRMDELFARADLVLSRAGATTVAELIEFAVPSILVPIAVSVGDHQRRNARYLASRGGAELLEEARFTPESLVAAAADALRGARLAAMRADLERLRAPGAAGRVAALLEEVAGGHGQGRA